MLRADASDEKEMRRAFKEAEKRFGEINGVIHAAGVPQMTAIQEMSLEKWEEQFRGKVFGLLVLKKVLEGRKLDFCYVTSSLSSVLGGLGFGAYAAANQYLDSFVQQENKRSSFPWISVNFDGWDFGWTREQEGIRGISPEEGEEVFTRSLQMRTEGAIIISTQALDHRMAQWIYFKEAGAEEGKAIKQRRYERPVLGTAYVRARKRNGACHCRSMAGSIESREDPKHSRQFF